MTPSSPWALLKKAIQGQRSSKRGTLCASFAYHKERYNMWDIDLSFLQESAQIFLDEFVYKYYRIHTKSGQIFLVINTIQNYPHLIGIHRQQLSRLRGSSFLFACIQNNDTSVWTYSMKRVFNSIYPNCRPYGLNDIKITFFSLMPDIFVRDNYVISVNYDKNARNDNRVFNTEILISDFNEGMNIGMIQKSDFSFGFNSWRVEDSESNIMDMYRNQTVDLIDRIETFKDGTLIHTKTLTLKNTNLWRLSRLVKNYGVTIVDSKEADKINFLSIYEDTEFNVAFEDLKREYEK